MPPRIDLLEKLTVVLDEHKDNGIKFDLCEWKRVVVVNHVCQTTCCAIGLGIERVPEIAALLRLNRSQEELQSQFPEDSLQLANCEGSERTTDVMMVDEGSYATGFYAVESAFELDVDQAKHLFMAFSYPNKDKTTPQEVASRIRSFIQEVSNAGN